MVIELEGSQRKCAWWIAIPIRILHFVNQHFTTDFAMAKLPQ